MKFLKVKYELPFLLLVSLSLLYACQDEGTSEPIQIQHHPLNPVLPYDELDISSGKRFDILSADKTKLDFSNDLKLSYTHNFFEFLNLFLGSGLGIGDFNKDGLPDIYFAGSLVDDKIYINQSNLTFEDISQTALPAEDKATTSTGITIVDINNDGYDDIYVCRSYYPKDLERRKNKLFINNQDLTFTDQAESYGLADTSFSIHASFFDYDNDGDLDMYLLNHPIDWNDRTKLNNYEKVGEGKNLSDKLYQNNNDGTFTDVSTKAGINNHGFGLSATTADYNNDGWMDIYVSNDWTMHDHLYMNQKDGTFKDESRERFTKFSYSSMGSDAADYNNDGHLDIITAELEYTDNLLHKAYVHNTPSLSRVRGLQKSGYHTQYFHNALHLNNGDGNFTEIAYASNVGSTDWSWASFFADFDHDGLQDIFISNGNYRQVNEDERSTTKILKDAVRRKDSITYEKTLLGFDTIHSRSANPFYRNNGDLTFKDMTQAWGSNYPCVSNGAAYADLDNDGDLDVVVSNINESALIYRNNTNETQSDSLNYLSVKLKGTAKNKDGIGAKIMIQSKGKQQFRQMLSSRGSQSSTEKIFHFGLGNTKIIDTLFIEWQEGKTELLTKIKANQEIILDIRNARKSNLKISSFSRKSTVVNFKEKTSDSGISYQHKENEFDDLYKQGLLPHVQSRNGPGIAVADIDGDGLDDFVVGGASKSSGQIYLQTKEATFQKMPSTALEKDAKHEDMGMLLIDVDNDGDKDLYVASGGSEFEMNDEALQDRLYLNDGKGNFNKTDKWLPNLAVSSSCVTAADFDKDGFIDLFVGGQLKSGRYPEAGHSVLLRNTGTHFEDVTNDVSNLSQIGMVNAAIWTDFDNDSDPDLMVAGEWMSIHIFENENGKFTELESPELQSMSGWWNGITAMDFDSDGDMDYILTNHGENTRFHPKKNEPIKVYFDDFDQSGEIDPIVSYIQNGNEYPIANLPDLAGSISFVAQKYKSYTAYGKATIQDVLGERMNKTSQLKAATFSSILLENKGNNDFLSHRLPQMAQLSSLFGILTQDFDGDGYMDVLIHGNFFEKNVQYEKQDACTGLFLKGNGTPNFISIPYIESGFKQKGEGRALASILTADKELNILAGRNNDELIYFRNINTKSKVLPMQDKTTSVLVFQKNGKHTKYEFYEGTGYLSQHSKAIAVAKDEIEKVEEVDE